MSELSPSPVRLSINITIIVMHLHRCVIPMATADITLAPRDITGTPNPVTGAIIVTEDQITGATAILHGIGAGITAILTTVIAAIVASGNPMIVLIHPIRTSTLDDHIKIADAGGID